MNKRFLIITEGEADKKFLRDYYHHLFQEDAPEHSIIHTGELSDDNLTGGIEKLRREENIQAMRQNADQGGINLVIFDADEDFETRQQQLLEIKDQFYVEFESFLLPNNNDAGALEDLLERIINPNNQPVMDCWENYEDDLKAVRIPTKTPPTLTIPAKKTKIYAYLETLLGKSKSQKRLIKESERKYENPQHWNLDAEYLEPLKEFIFNKLK